MYELYSRRICNSLGEPEVYNYDSFPTQFRTQVLYILVDVLSYCQGTGLAFSWTSLHSSFAREKGVKTLYSANNSPARNIECFLDTCNDVDFLDFLDFAFAQISLVPTLRSIFSSEVEIGLLRPPQLHHHRGTDPPGIQPTEHCKLYSHCFYNHPGRLLSQAGFGRADHPG